MTHGEVFGTPVPERLVRDRVVLESNKGSSKINPGGCDRRPAACDVHHVTCIHRLGWQIELLPDGSTRATSPDRNTILRSHGPPPTAQPSG